MDLSPAMLTEAGKTGLYQKLFLGDLTRPVDIADERYEFVTCAGTFTHGHIARPRPCESGGFKREIETLEAEGLIKIFEATMPSSSC
ncbi:uncharacterized protein PG998_014213 [Apiospora kogelbergensis]|uniref:uncharacterized protein n=1 Tax=Apiospora kogelbergensis TaxID=1337665 RepID=UPI00312CF592